MRARADPGACVELAEVAPVQVKERTVRPFRVIGPGGRTAFSPEGNALSPFTGRDRELAELQRALDYALAGEGQVVGLAGDPGIGKSRLASEFIRLAEPSATILEGRCLSYGAGIPYLPIFELVRNACGIAVNEPADLAASKIELKVKSLDLDVALAHYLRHAFGLPTAGQDSAVVDPQAMRARTFDALRRLLLAAAARRPVVVLIEDLHWVDQTSEDFLAGFTDELPSAQIMLSVTYRPGYSPPWIGKSFASQLALRPLAPAACEQIVTSIIDRETDARLAATIAARGEGNPFFLEELARASQDRVTTATDGAVPATVQEVLAARIDRLSAEQKTVLQLAAVLGREFSLDLAWEIWDGGGSLDQRMQELKALEFLRERHGGAERTLVFKHALTRDVAYDGMLASRRRELHGRVAAIMERSGDRQLEHPELLGYHLARSAEPGRAIPHLAVAGDRASERYANEEAVALYQQAISLAEQLHADGYPDSYMTTCERLGTVLERLCRYDEATDAYDRALAIETDPLGRARLHHLCGFAEDGAHRYPRAVARCDLAEQALGPLPESPTTEWFTTWYDVQDLRMDVLYWLGDTEELARLIERTRPLIDAHGSLVQRANFLLNMAAFAMRRDRYFIAEETLRLHREAYALAAEEDFSALWWVTFNLGFALLWHGDLAEATAMLQVSLAESERHGDVTLRSRSLSYLLVADRKRGNVDGVRQAIGTVIDAARQGSLPEYEAMALANQSWVAWHGGDDAQAEADALAALDIWERLPARYFISWMALWQLIAIAVAAGQTEQAVDYARGLLRPPQQLPLEPARGLVDQAISEWDASRKAEAAETLASAITAARDLGYL
jgi:eukaryotic-like serine/threonine-protein kinase